MDTKIHSHKTKEEEIECAVWFGECWNVQNKQITKENKHGFSNTPHGVFQPDMDSRSFLK
jgi:hypothetical protein